MGSIESKCKDSRSLRTDTQSQNHTTGLSPERPDADVDADFGATDDRLTIDAEPGDRGSTMPGIRAVSMLEAR